MRRTFLTLTLALALAAALPAAPAAAQSAPAARCGDRARIVALLSGTWGETRRAAGLAAGGVVVEVYASAETGSWTIAATLPDGRMCLIAAGEGYEEAPAAPAHGLPA